MVNILPTDLRIQKTLTLKLDGEEIVNNRGRVNITEVNLQNIHLYLLKEKIYQPDKCLKLETKSKFAVT